MAWYWWIPIGYLSIGLVYTIVSGVGVGVGVIVMGLLTVDQDPLSLPNPTLGEIVMCAIAFVIAVAMWSVFVVWAKL